MDSGAAARPSPLPIDLNSPPAAAPTAGEGAAVVGWPRDAYELACRYHAVGGQPPGAPGVAEHPGEAGTGPTVMCCGTCGMPETRGATLVCDACERGFHLGCARVLRRLTEDWVCGECAESGLSRRRWRTGSARLLDINAAPLSDGEGDAVELRSSVNEKCRHCFFLLVLLLLYSLCSLNSSHSESAYIRLTI